MARRVAGLSQPLTERPDYGRGAGYLDDRASVPNPERLEDWRGTSAGADLLHLCAELESAAPEALPHVLKNLANAANEVLLYVKS